MESTSSKSTPFSQNIIRSALLIDFDNIYSDLDALDRNAAAEFVNAPQRWLDWLLVQAIEDPKYDSFFRRIIVKRLYINPEAFGSARKYFVRSGFQTVDCPPLTKNGKTSADIHLVIDVLDLLMAEPSIDEFIIMSTDADFTPVLRRLSRYDRRSIVLAMGRAAAAYKACCDLLLDPKEFLQAVLGIEETDEEVRPPSKPLNAPKPPTVEFAGNSHPPVIASASRPQPKDVLEAVRQLVDASSHPITMAAAAHQLKTRFGEPVLDLWQPPMKFKDFLLGAPERGFEVSGIMPGYIYDPTRHQLPERANPILKIPDSEVAELAQRVHTLTDAPMLLPEQHSALLKELAQEINSNGYHIVGTPKAVRDKCAASGTAVPRSAINFVIRGIIITGHRYQKGSESVAELGALYSRNIVNLCADVGWEFTNEQKQVLLRWINTGN